MTLGSPLPLAVAALCSAIALGSCRTSSRQEPAALTRLAPVPVAAANETASTVPALTLAVSDAGRARAYERAVASAALSYEFEKQTCQALARASRAACLDGAFEHFAGARAKAHAQRMAALAD
jgi:hypothetical protein